MISKGIRVMPGHICATLALLSYLLKSVDGALCGENATYWSKWWSYSGVSGPDSWDNHNRQDWGICRTGKHQSPINIEPHTLLFDPHLKPMKLDFTTVNGVLKNTENDITFYIRDNGVHLNVTSGPLSYMYRLYQIKFHFGTKDDGGSEHQISGTTFAGELQFMAYNAELYANDEEAARSPRGLAILAVFITIAEEEHTAFNVFRTKFLEIAKGDSCTNVTNLQVDQLLPDTEHYVTYSGSLTQPACKETVTWIIFNKPIHISPEQMKDLRGIYQQWLRSNTRPVRPLYHRTVRTNIDYKKKSRLCSMEVERFYQVNPRINQ